MAVLAHGQDKKWREKENVNEAADLLPTAKLPAPRVTYHALSDHLMTMMADVAARRL